MQSLIAVSLVFLDNSRDRRAVRRLHCTLDPDAIIEAFAHRLFVDHVGQLGQCL